MLLRSLADRGSPAALVRARAAGGGRRLAGAHRVTVAGRTPEVHHRRAARASGRGDDHGAAGRRVQARDDLPRGARCRCCSPACRATTSVRFVAADGFAATLAAAPLLATADDAPRALSRRRAAPTPPWPPLKAGSQANRGSVLSRVAAPRTRPHLARAVALPDRAHRGRRTRGACASRRLAPAASVRRQRSRSATASRCSRPTACPATR